MIAPEGGRVASRPAHIRPHASSISSRGSHPELTFPVRPETLNRMVQSLVLDRTFSALSDPTRRDILERLSTGPASISELARPIGISLPGVMKHVRILEEANLVTTEKHGRIRECRLAPGDIDEVTRWIERYREQWERRLDRLEAYIREQQGRGTS